jgi:hypothetical protein
MTQREFGAAVGASHRTAVRWDAGHASPGPSDLRAMAALVLPHDRDLAIEIAASMHETLQSLGLEAPPPPPPAPLPPPLPRPAAEDLVDILVCAAVEATGQPPAAMRPLIYRLFKRAREVGLETRDVERALQPPPPAPPHPEGQP